MLGVPNPTYISTSIIERLNLSVRQSVRRYARATNAFSKRVMHHAAATDRYFFMHNFVRVHGSLGCTPAQAAGLTERRWTLGDIVDIVAAAAPRPARPRLHRVRRWQSRPEGLQARAK